MPEIKEFFTKMDEGNLKNRLRAVSIWVVISIIAMIALSSFLGGDKDEEKAGIAETEYSKRSAANYIEESERRLEAKLSGVKGAGKVTVMISAENSGESVLAKDTKSKTEQSGLSDSDELKSVNESEQKIVFSGQSSNSNPVIVAENTPKLTGVIVIADGAGDEMVKNELYEAVKALYGLAAHRVKVMVGGQSAGTP